MSDSSHHILHVKDSYYFQVPKSLWRYHAMRDVPDWLVKTEEHHSLIDWQQELDGKILIPQPLGTLKNLYTPSSGFCISRFMLLELLAAVGAAQEAAKRQDILLAGQIGRVASPAPSIWPLLTAATLGVFPGMTIRLASSGDPAG